MVTLLSSLHSMIEEEARRLAVLNAIRLNPDLADAHVVLALARARLGDWSGAESEYRRAVELGSDRSLYLNDAHVFRFSVGDFRGGQAILDSARRNDPLNGTARSFCMLSLASFGNLEGAEEEYAIGSRLFGPAWIGQFHILHVRLGATDGVSLDGIPQGWLMQGRGQAYLDSPSEGLEELHRFYDEDRNVWTGKGGHDQASLLHIAGWAAHLGDAEFALEVMERLLELNALHAYYLWLPSMREVRRLPRFAAVIREIGLVDYWDNYEVARDMSPTRRQQFGM